MIRRLPLALATGGALLGVVAIAQPVTWTAPDEVTPTELASKDAEVVANSCASCHSLDYITTQPRGKGAQFWGDAVTKMVEVYGAPLEPQDAAAVSQVLARKFG